MRSRKLRLKKIYVALSLLLILLIGYLAYSKLLVIKNISWQLNNVDCTTVADLSRNFKLSGQLLSKVDQRQLEQSLKSDYPCIRSIDLNKNLLGSTKITLNGRTPFIKIVPYQTISNLALDSLEASPSSTSALVDYTVPNSLNQPLLVDSDGMLYKQADGDYPILYWDEEVSLGRLINPQIWNQLAVIINNLIQLKQQNLISITSSQPTFKKQWDNLIVFSNPSLLFNISGASDSRDVFNSLTSLQLILKTAKINNKTIKSIDLRFDKPIVVYNSPAQNQ